MALNGTLDDIGIIDLVQYPHSGRRTGMLVIQRSEGRGPAEARLFYREGNLVHAQLGRADGEDALVDLVDWGNGRFTFHTGQEQRRVTIRGDLHRTLMKVLKLRDERGPVAPDSGGGIDDRRRKLLERWAAPEDVDGAVFDVLVAQLEANPVNSHASVREADGALVAEASRQARRPDGLDELVELFRQLVADYPRQTPRRLIVEEAEGQAVFSVGQSGRTVLVLASKGAPTGAVLMGASRLINALNDQEGRR